MCERTRQRGGEHRRRRHLDGCAPYLLEAVELLLKKVDFDVPESQVAHARDMYLKELELRAQYSGLDASYFEQNRDKILKDADEAATRRVRLWYVVDAIAKAEKIEAKDDELGKKVVEFILANAKK